MEAEKHYFLEGLFIIGFTVAAALAFAWLARTGHHDDVLYRIRFEESVSGLSLGDPVKFHGVDIGSVKAMKIDTADPNLVQVDVSLRKEAPVKVDTKASLKLKGITGTVFVELNGGGAGAQSLVEATAPGQVPEIASEKSQLTTLLETVPKALESLSGLGGQAKKLMADVGGVTSTMKSAASDVKETTAKIKEDPTLLLRHPKKKEGEAK